MIDPCLKYVMDKRDAEKKVEELIEKYGSAYWKEPEYSSLAEIIRYCNRRIEYFERMKRMGVKF
jgi:hypothetical protein